MIDPRLVVVLVVLLAPVVIYVRGRLDMTPAERQEESTRKQWGDTNSALVCPHCQTQGQVRTMAVQRKKGISGGKAAGALLTGGVSMLATGLYRKEGAIQAHCDHCNSTWDF